MSTKALSSVPSIPWLTSPFLTRLNAELGIIVMAESNISCTTPINIPLERSLYVGNMLSGIIYGEIINRQGIGHFVRTLHSWRQDWIYSHSLPPYIASPIVPLTIAKARECT